MPRGVYIRTAEHNHNISLGLRGHTSWFAGKHHSEKSIMKNRLAHLGKPGPNKGKKFGHMSKDERQMRSIAAKNSSKIQSHLQRIHKTNSVYRYISKSATLFLDKIEELFNIKIEREYNIAQSFFDGHYNNILLEVDSDYWHKRTKVNDTFKTYLARTHGYELHRFKIDRIDEVESKILEYKKKLEEIFGDKKCQTIQS